MSFCFECGRGIMQEKTSIRAADFLQRNTRKKFPVTIHLKVSFDFAEQQENARCRLGHILTWTKSGKDAKDSGCYKSGKKHSSR